MGTLMTLCGMLMNRNRTFTQALSAIKNEMGTMAQHHLELAEAIRRDLELRLAAFMEYQYVLL